MRILAAVTIGFFFVSLITGERFMPNPEQKGGWLACAIVCGLTLAAWTLITWIA